MPRRSASEIAIIAAYLPQADVGRRGGRGRSRALVKETGATGIKDMGRVMAALKERYAGQMDFAKASGDGEEAAVGTAG